MSRSYSAFYGGADDGGPCSSLCTCCLKMVLALGFSALVFWLLYRPIAPRYYIISLSLPSPPGGNLTSASSASFQLEIENKNKHMGICHDPIALSLVPPRGNLTAAQSSTATLPAFYQGHQKTAEKYGNFTIGGMGVGNGSGVAVEVRAESGYRFKVFFWKTRRRQVMVWGDVEVGADGKNTAEKGIRLSYATATGNSRECYYWLVSVVVLAHYFFSL